MREHKIKLTWRSPCGAVVLHCADCADVFPTLGEGAVDLVLMDPPYGVTACVWDIPLSPELLWAQVARVVGKGAPVVVMAQQPFTSDLVVAWRKYFRHSWVWNKHFAGCFATCNKQPLKIHEDILVFGARGVRYNPQKTQRMVPIKLGGKLRSVTSPLASRFPDKKTYTDKFPVSIIDISNRSEPRGFHPTQKPVALMEYLIQTYSDLRGCVFDPVMGSGSAGVACIRAGRRFVGVEVDRNYFSVAVRRIEKALRERDKSQLGAVN